MDTHNEFIYILDDEGAPFCSRFLPALGCSGGATSMSSSSSLPKMRACRLAASSSSAIVAHADDTRRASPHSEAEALLAERS